jgi:nucleotide-binding universal stress UspA family protein
MKTLICIRHLPYSEPTVKFGGLIANLEDSPLTVLTVIKKVADKTEAKINLEQAISILDREDVEKIIRKGDVLTEIFKEAKEGDYDVIVVGTQEVDRLLDMFLGTVTGKIAGKAHSSVLVVRGDRPVKLDKMLIAIGGQKMNQEVVKVGARIARASQAEVRVLYVTSPVPTMYTGLDEMEETLEELLQTDTPIARYLRWSALYLADQGLEAKLELAQGVDTDEIMRQALQGGYDLLVIGASAARGIFGRIFTEQVTPQVVERSPCSVLVVR